MILTVAHWRGAGEKFEPFYKRAVVVKSAVQRDAGDGVGGVLDRVDRVKHPHLLDKGLRRHFHALTKDAHEVAFRKTAQLRQRADRDRFGVVSEDMLDRRQQTVQFGVAAHDFAVGAVDRDESDGFSVAIVERVFAGKCPLGSMGEETGGMHFIYQRPAVLEDEEVVLPEALGDDFREEVEVGLDRKSVV